jgi:hypothetical protein
MAQHARYLAASTPQSLMRRAVNASLTGPEHSVIVLTIRDRENNVKEEKQKPLYLMGAVIPKGRLGKLHPA